MEKDKINYMFVFNKIFTGSYLIYNLGNELINFIKTDNNGSKYGNKRLVYINPYGNRSNKAAKETEYALHIMGVTYKGENYYELVAVSKIKKGVQTHYNTKTMKERDNYKEEKVKFEGHLLGDVFSDEKSHLCSFIAEEFYTIKKDVHILFNVSSKIEDVDKKLKSLDENSTTIVNINCNPKRSMCYSKDVDIEVLKDIINSNHLKKEKESNIDLSKYNDEQCLAVICDRTNLEDSTSNQIAYFLSRDKKLLSKFIKFINKNLDDKMIDPEESFEILREENHIDLLLKSKNYLIVIENKIDSHINGIKESNKKKKKSQLSAYYNYVNKDKELKGIKNKYFFILQPKYNSITRTKLDKEFENGKEYKIIYYDDLYREVVKGYIYNPYGKNTNKEKSQFLYEQFEEGIKYIKSTKAEQMQETAYIRLNQKINELKKNRIIKG